MTRNLWDDDQKKIFRELYRQYVGEGYSHKEAKQLASEEAQELAGMDKDFIQGILNAEYGEEDE